jgi:8-oxo-dGTP pyrophosphatase MutT (NUDIX family)
VNGNKLVVVRAWLGDGKWSLPGGGVHKGETSKDCVIRELEEETYLKLTPAGINFLSKERIKTHGITTNLDYFFCVLPKQRTLKVRPPEITDVSWVDVDILDEKVADSDIIKGLRLWKQTAHFATIGHVSEPDN